MAVKVEKGAPISGMKIYIGYDPEQEDASRVCEYSIHKHAKVDVDIVHLKTEELREQGLYWRTDTGSTDFSYSRFLVPHLQNYNGWAIFVDSDFVFTKDIYTLGDELAQTPNADLMSCFVIRHAPYVPAQETKFYGRKQEQLPMKNWSSLIFYNCGHEHTKKLTPMLVNNQSPKFLHRFEWTQDHVIGMMDVRWNWLVGEYGICQGEPWGLHFTNGGPFNNEWGQDYEDIWLEYFHELTGLDYKNDNS